MAPKQEKPVLLRSFKIGGVEHATENGSGNGVSPPKAFEPLFGFTSGLMYQTLERVDGAVGHLAFDGHGPTIIQTDNDIGLGIAQLAFATELAGRRRSIAVSAVALTAIFD